MSSASQRADVVVIGAGMAGVAAAYSLKQFDSDLEVIVLEGRDRLGGRIHTFRDWPEAPIDLGASWVSHLTINPLGAIAKEQKIKLADSDLMNVNLREAGGRELSQDETGKTMLRFFEAYSEVKQRAAERREAGKRDTDAGREFTRALKKMKLRGQKRLNVEYFINMSIAEANATNLDRLSLYEWEDDYIETMIRAAVVPDGYVLFVEALAEGLDIRRNHVVACVEYDDDGVTVKTNHGDFSARYAVVTLPHAVLAGGSVTFYPKLPSWKRDAIKSVGVGVSDKFYFLFPERFWTSDQDILGRVDEKGEGRWSTWVNFHKYTGLPILMCFNRSEHALALEKMSDDDVTKEAMKVLRRAYKKVPWPLKMKRSTWHSDQFAQGTIPYIPPRSSTAAYNTLARPVGRLRFAGDSTQREFNGMVLGAFISGVREAEKLMPLLWGEG
ncbi:MAG TPA: FAD-dependent oxidoreductase [Thermoanaerobaculia bacterium]